MASRGFHVGWEWGKIGGKSIFTLKALLLAAWHLVPDCRHLELRILHLNFQMPAPTTKFLGVRCSVPHKRKGDTFSIYWEQLLKVLKISNLLVASKKSNISVVDV